MNDHEEFDDIPGTTVFTTKRSRQGFQLNQFCMSLMKEENRERFRADERGSSPASFAGAALAPIVLPARPE